MLTWFICFTGPTTGAASTGAEAPAAAISAPSVPSSSRRELWHVAERIGRRRAATVEPPRMGVSGEFVDRGCERAAIGGAWRPWASDTAHDSATASDTRGDWPARRPCPALAGVLPERHAS